MDPLQALTDHLIEEMTVDEAEFLGLVEAALDMYGYDVSEASIVDIADYVRQLLAKQNLRLILTRTEA